MDKKIERYYRLKQDQKEIEQELTELRGEILQLCTEQGRSELEVEGYRVKLIHQERKEYDEARLYEALPDPQVWRLLSKPDPSKIASLIKLNVIPEEKLQDTFSVKQVTLLQIDKR